MDSERSVEFRVIDREQPWDPGLWKERKEAGVGTGRGQIVMQVPQPPSAGSTGNTGANSPSEWS